MFHIGLAFDRPDFYRAILKYNTVDDLSPWLSFFSYKPQTTPTHFFFLLQSIEPA
jgi:hypothetical protein